MGSADFLIIPERYLDELRQKSDDEIDVLRAFGDMLANDYIKLFPPKDRSVWLAKAPRDDTDVHSAPRLPIASSRSN